MNIDRKRLSCTRRHRALPNLPRCWPTTRKDSLRNTFEGKGFSRCHPVNKSNIQPWHPAGLLRNAAASTAAAWTALALVASVLASRALHPATAPPLHHQATSPQTAPAAAARAPPSSSSPSSSSSPAPTPRRPLAPLASISVSSSSSLVSSSQSPATQVGRLLQRQSAAFYDGLAFLNYKVLQAMTLPTWGKMLMVVLVAGVILFGGTLALWGWTRLHPAAALWRCYLILNNVPGADITNEPDARVAVVLNVVYTVGLLTFAALVGVVADDISSAVEAARLGNFRVPERNHTVVLGYNRQLVEVLRQVALVRADRGAAAFPGQLVVLSDRDRSSLEDTLVEALGPAAAAGVVTRQGSPLKVVDLQRVSAGHARTVILLAPESRDEEAMAAVEGDGGGGGAAGDVSDGEGASSSSSLCLGLSLEARQSVTLVALHHLRRQALEGRGGSSLGREPQTVIVQHDADLDLLDPDVFTRTAGAGGGGTDGPAASRHLVTPVSHINSLSRIQAQCAPQPGLSVVMGSILQQQPGLPEFYVQHVPEVVGLTYGDARRLFPRAVLCGVYDPAAATAFAANSAEARLDAAAKAVVLNPPDSILLLERYSLVLLADRTDDLRVSQTRLRELRRQQHDSVTAVAATAAKCTKQQAFGGFFSPRREETQQQQQQGPPHRVFRGGMRAERGAAPLRVVVLVFNGQPAEELLQGLCDYCPPGSEAVVVACKDTAASRGPPGCLKQQRRLRVVTVPGDPRTRGSLRQAGAQEADAVILTGLEGVSTDQADAQALATLIQLQALMPPLRPAAPASSSTASSAPASSSTAASSSWASPSSSAAAAARPPLNLVCVVSDPRVREIMSNLVQVQTSGGAGGGSGTAWRPTITLDTINSDELLAGVLTQVAAEPRLSGLFHELSTAEGVEIHLRTPAALGLPHEQPLMWEEVQDTGRQHGVTVIGLLRAAGADAMQPRLLLGVPLRPAARATSAVLEFRPGDKVVVLSGE